MAETIDNLLTAPGIDPEELVDTDFAGSFLKKGGLDDISALRMSEQFSRCSSKLRSFRSAASVHALYVPGRIEVLGKHTDYAGGGSLVCALRLGAAFVCAARDDRRFRIFDAGTGLSVELRIDRDESPRPGEWSNYAVAVARRLARDFGASRGADVVFSSNLPASSGMSSSSVLTVGFGLVAAAASGLSERSLLKEQIGSPLRLAQYFGAVENGLPFGSLQEDSGVGTFGGSEDHTAILCSSPDTVKWFSYRPVRFLKSVRFPAGHCFAIACSGVTASKTKEALDRYNYLSDTTAEIAAAWCAATRRDGMHLGAIVEEGGFTLDRLKAVVREKPSSRYSVSQLLSRLDHFYTENIVLLPAAVDALQTVDLEVFGAIVDQSQHLAERLLANQTPETVLLAAEARRQGALAASAFGAGFGGSVWALVPDERAETFLASWSRAYEDAFPGAAERSTFFVDTPGPAAFWLGG